MVAKSQVNELNLANRVALVTGAASGIGRATARRLAAAGIAVAVADLNSSGAKEVSDELIAHGGAAIGISVDVTDARSVDDAVAATADQLGRLDILVANAGIAHLPTPALELDEQLFSTIFEVNVKGAWLCARSAVPVMRATGGGSIIITGSVMGERTRPGFSAYAPSKAASNHLARTLALELAPDIRVNAVAPVATDTAMLPSFLGNENPDRAREAFINGIPMARLANPDDVADAIAYLASDAASFITGVVLPVDGGRAV